MSNKIRHDDDEQKKNNFKQEGWGDFSASFGNVNYLLYNNTNLKLLLRSFDFGFALNHCL